MEELEGMSVAGLTYLTVLMKSLPGLLVTKGREPADQTRISPSRKSLASLCSFLFDVSFALLPYFPRAWSRGLVPHLLHRG